MFRSCSPDDLRTGSEAVREWASTLSLRLVRVFVLFVRASMVQRCWAAYARHGRQASALATTSAVRAGLPRLALAPVEARYPLLERRPAHARHAWRCTVPSIHRYRGSSGVWQLRPLMFGWD